MDHDYAQRRRVAVAIAVTVIAVPAAFLLNRGEATEPSDALIGAGQVPATSTALPSDVQPAVTSPLGTAPTGYLEGSTVPESNEPARIAIPLLADSIKIQATYSSTITSTQRCSVPGAPFNATVTITNLDNSHRVQCIASVAAPDPNGNAVLAPAAFAEIADPTDAPVPVEITWSGS